MENTQKEVWKDIKGYEGKYLISNMGRVWSVKNQIYLKPARNKLGYLRVLLIAKNGKRKNEFVHRLVALMFVPNPNHYPIVNHKDNNPSNLIASNLEWCTYKYNIEYNDAHKRTAKHNQKIIYLIKNDEVIAEYESAVTAEQQTGINRCNISACVHGKRKNAGGYAWKTK